MKFFVERKIRTIFSDDTDDIHIKFNSKVLNAKHFLAAKVAKTFYVSKILLLNLLNLTFQSFCVEAKHESIL